MDYKNFYSQEQVDKYLEAIRDGKIDSKDALESKRSIYNYSIGPMSINPYYLTPFIAYDCHVEAGTCVAIIRPNLVNRSTS